MSWRGREVVRHIDRGLLKLEADWWANYADRLTPQERQRISRGDYHGFKRPYPPSFQAGDVLEAGPKLAIEIADVELKRGEWRCRIGRVRDNRPPRSYSPRPRRLHEDPELMKSTLAVVGDPDPPEPEGPPPSKVPHYADSRAARERYEREQAKRRAAHDQLPVEFRLARLRRMARDRSIDISSEERVIERRIAALERRILDGEAAA